MQPRIQEILVLLLFSPYLVLVDAGTLSCATIDPSLSELKEMRRGVPQVLCRCSGSLSIANRSSRHPLKNIFLHSTAENGGKMTRNTVTCRYEREKDFLFTMKDASCDPQGESNHFTMPSTSRLYWSDLPYELKDVVPHSLHTLCERTSTRTVFKSDKPFWRVHRDEQCQLHIERPELRFPVVALDASSYDDMIRIHEPGFGVSFGYAADIIIGEKNEMVLIMMDVLTDGSVDFAILREVKNPVQELADYYDDEGQVEKTEIEELSVVSPQQRMSAPEVLISNFNNSGLGVSDYFRQHNLENFLTDLLRRLAEELPDDPAEFMCSYIREKIPSNSGSCAISDHRRFTTDGHLTSMRSIALHRFSEQLEKENLSINSFVQGWIDRPGLLSSTRRPSHTRSDATPRKDRHNDANAPVMLTTVELFRNWHQSEGKCRSSLEDLLSWEMDVLGTAEGTLAHHALSVLDLWGFFNDQDLSVGVVAIDMIRMQGFISDLFHRYHSDNPYHNFKHAYSVMSAAGSLMRYGGADEFCSPLEQLALLIAAVSHDVGHNGVNNDYYVKKVHPLAIRYNDQAVLESMHSALTFELILTKKNNFLADWQEEAFADFRKTTIAAILATDMKVHFDLTTQMQDLRSALEVDTSCPDTKMLVHKCLVHAADISNAVLPTDMYEAWAYRVSTEFYRQSLREKSEGIPTAPFMDSSPDDRAEFAVLQLGFMNFVVAPLWNAMADMWPALEPRRKQLAENVEYFKKLRESVKTEEDCPAE